MPPGPDTTPEPAPPEPASNPAMPEKRDGDMRSAQRVYIYTASGSVPCAIAVVLLCFFHVRPEHHASRSGDCSRIPPNHARVRLCRCAPAGAKTAPSLARAYPNSMASAVCRKHPAGVACQVPPAGRTAQSAAGSAGVTPGRTRPHPSRRAPCPAWYVPNMGGSGSGRPQHRS